MKNLVLLHDFNYLILLAVIAGVVLLFLIISFIIYCFTPKSVKEKDANFQKELRELKKNVNETRS